METDECVECIGPERLREMQDAEELRRKARRVHRLLHELSDAGQTILELVRTTGMPAAQVRGLLEELAALGLVTFGEERFGHHSRWLWSRPPPSARKPPPLPGPGARAKSVLYG